MDNLILGGNNKREQPVRRGAATAPLIGLPQYHGAITALTQIDITGNDVGRNASLDWGTMYTFFSVCC